MHLLITQYEVSIDVHNHRLRISSGEAVRSIPPHRVSALHLLKPVTISTPALMLLAAQHIPVLMYDLRGRVQAAVWSPRFGSLSQIRKQQIKFCEHPLAMAQIVIWLSEKFDAQAANLQWLADRKPSEKDRLHASIHKLKGYQERLHLLLPEEEHIKPLLLLTEARAAKYYWAAVAAAMANLTGFTGRNKRPARDRFNALLNYTYGILYGLTESALFAAGLDPHHGLLHADDYNTPSLSFDLIEPFRPWADKFCMTQFMQLPENEKFFDTDKRGHVLLNREGKKIFIPAFFDFLSQRVRQQHKLIKKQDLIQYKATMLAQFLLKEFKP